MESPVLIAAPPRLARQLADRIGDRFELVICSDRDKVAALARIGRYLAIVQTLGFGQLLTGTPVLPVSDPSDPRLVEQLDAFRARTRGDQRDRAESLAPLATLSYEEYMAVARASVVRDYLLALLHAHRGVVSEAARAAGILRETLHRLIRRHHIDTGWFRDPEI